MAWAEAREKVAEKKRIDVLLVETGYFDSREKARAALMAGDVTVNGAIVDKPGQKVQAGKEDITIKQKNALCQPGRLQTGPGTASFSH